jgi:hypothetical protein
MEGVFRCLSKYESINKLEPFWKDIYTKKLKFLISESKNLPGDLRGAVE